LGCGIAISIVDVDLQGVVEKVDGGDGVVHPPVVVIDIDDGDGDPTTQANSALESLDIRMVFLDEGRGRAEAMASGGDLVDNPDIELLEVVECWDAGVNTTYLGMTAYGVDGVALGTESLGAPAQCAPMFDQSIEQLEIPTLDSVDPVLKAQMDTLAADGIQ
ncbi:MAG: hypothetical protein AAFX99_05550, partial [Myxococcota bacterium]